MPRNGQGVYSLPQAAFVPGTTISSAAVNSDFSDIAAALTGSVSADGQTPITGALKSSVISGPAFTNTSDTTTGFGVSVAGEADIWASGQKVVTTTQSLVSVNAVLNVADPATLASSLHVAGDVTVGGALNLGGSTGSFNLPDGTTAQRGTLATQSAVRYNNTLGGFEGYDGTEWVPMSSIPTAYTLSASNDGTLLTVNVLNWYTGATPTTADPIRIVFPDATAANGDPVSVVVSSALTINTNQAGATLGTINNQPFRFWIVCFNNGGTPVLALINCNTGTGIFPLNPQIPQSTTGISSGATSAGVFYSPNGVTVSNSCFTILGYLEYSSGLATAGTYLSNPTALRLFTSGIHKPGEIVQTRTNVVNTPGIGTVSPAYNLSTITPPSTSGAVSLISQAITVTSAMNQLRVTCFPWLSFNQTVGNFWPFLFLYNGSTNLLTIVPSPGGGTEASSTNVYCSPLRWRSLAGGTSTVTFSVYAHSDANNQPIYINQTDSGGVVKPIVGTTAGTYLEIEEIMG